MKKLLVLFLLILALGCSKDDEPGLDPIIGNFRIVEASMNGEKLELEYCQDLFTMDFFLFNMGTYTLYGDSIGGNCEANTIADLYWERNGKNYTITSDIPFFDGTIVPTNSAPATLKNNVLTITINYGGLDLKMVYRKLNPKPGN